MMTIFDNPALTRELAIAAAGVVVGLLFSIGRGLNTHIWKYKRDAVAVPKSELFFAIVMAFVPITKVLYALIAASVLAQRNLANSELSIVATFAGGAFALIAVVQGGQFEVIGLELFHALGGFEEAHQVCDDALIDFSSYNE